MSSKVLEAIKTPEGQARVNEALAVMCGIPREKGALRQIQQMWPPRFLAGLLPDGSCDEEQVDGALLWRVMRAAARDNEISLRAYWDDDTDSKAWDAEAWDDSSGISCHHAHPTVAMAELAEGLGLLWKGDAQ